MVKQGKKPTVEEVLGYLSKRGGRLEFAVEGAWTNMIVWNSDAIYIRLDCLRQYWVPMYNHLHYLNAPNDSLKKLAEYGWEIPVEHLNDIAKILTKFTVRNCREW